MTKNELVSVIVPVYNRADTIVRAIDSVINQTYKNVEIIIIDDGSSDNLKSILDEIKYNNIHYYYQENSGASSARNHGLLKARGKYCIYLDSDDELLPDCIESLVDLSINHNLNYITYNAELVYKQKKIVKKYDKSFFITQENVALDQIPLKGSQLFFKLDNNSKEFLFDTNLSVCEDIDIMLRILQKNKIFFYNKVLLKMYRFGTNNRLSKNIEAKINGNINFIKKIDKSYFPLNIKKILLSKMYFELFLLNCLILNKKEMRKYLKLFYKESDSFFKRLIVFYTYLHFSAPILNKVSVFFIKKLILC